jgi:hypothetical protein
MSLSNETRLKGIYECVYLLTTKKKEYLYKYKKCETTKYLMYLLNKLWHNLLEKQVMAGWLNGSSSSNTVYWDTTTPWGVSINYHCDGLLSGEEELSSNPDLVDNLLDTYLSIEYLLNECSEEYGFVYYVYNISETLTYYIRRYHWDDMGLTTLNKLVSDIQGECYSIFHENSVFSVAYITNLLLTEYIYTFKYSQLSTKDDVVVNWLLKESLHVSLSKCLGYGVNDMDLSDLAQKHKYLHQKDELVTPFDRLLLVVKLCGSEFSSKSNINSLMNLISNHNLCTEEEKESLSQAFYKNVLLKSKFEQDTREQYKTNPLSIYAIDLK